MESHGFYLFSKRQRSFKYIVISLEFILSNFDKRMILIYVILIVAVNLKIFE